MVKFGRRHRQGRADHQDRDQVEGERHHQGAAGQRRQPGRRGRRARRAGQGAAARAGARRGGQPPRRAGRARRRRSAAQEEPRRGRRARRRVRAPCLRARPVAVRAEPDRRSPRSTTRRALWTWRKTASAPRSRSSRSARPGSPRRGPRWRRPRPRPTAPPRTSPTRRSARRFAATVLTRDVEIGSPVSSILNLGANATLVMTLGDIDQVFVRGKVDEADIGHVRLGQHGPHPRRDVQGQGVQRTRHADLADGGREGQRHQLRGPRLDRQSRARSSRRT